MGWEVYAVMVPKMDISQLIYKLTFLCGSVKINFKNIWKLLRRKALVLVKVCIAIFSVLPLAVVIQTSLVLIVIT